MLQELNGVEIKEFDMLFKHDDCTFTVGMVYPCENGNGGYELWASHHQWNPNEMSFKEFCFDWECDAYTWEDLASTNEAEKIFKDYCNCSSTSEVKIYGTLDFLLKDIKVGEVAVYLPSAKGIMYGAN